MHRTRCLNNCMNIMIDNKELKNLSHTDFDRLRRARNSGPLSVAWFYDHALKSDETTLLKKELKKFDIKLPLYKGSTYTNFSMTPKTKLSAV